MADMEQDLINRLRGIYVTKVDDGAGLLNGKDTFTREFPVPPICKEAAIFIEAQEAEIKRLRACLEDADIWIPQMREAVNKGGEWFWLDARMMDLEAWHKDIKATLKGE